MLVMTMQRRLYAMSLVRVPGLVCLPVVSLSTMSTGDRGESVQKRLIQTDYDADDEDLVQKTGGFCRFPSRYSPGCDGESKRRTLGGARVDVVGFLFGQRQDLLAEVWAGRTD